MISTLNWPASNQMPTQHLFGCPEVRSLKRKFCDRVNLKWEKCKLQERSANSKFEQKIRNQKNVHSYLCGSMILVNAKKNILTQTARSAAARLMSVIHNPLRSIFKGSARLTMIMRKFNKKPTPVMAALQI